MNPILLDLGIIKIYWYSIAILLGLLIGGTVAIKEAKKWSIDEDFMLNLFFYLIPFSIVGARMYYVAFNFSYYQNNIIDIIKIWEGGLAIHGAIIAGLLFIIVYCKKYKVSTYRLLDILVVGLLIGQAIGRWGNFFNQEAYGKITSLKFLKSIYIPNFIIKGMHINGNYYHPTFFYEFLYCLMGFILILFIRRYKYIKVGQITAFYLVWYGTGRFFIEKLRTDSLMFKDFKVAQIVSLVMILAGFIIYITKWRDSKLSNLYNDEENIKDVDF